MGSDGAKWLTRHTYDDFCGNLDTARPTLGKKAGHRPWGTTVIEAMGATYARRDDENSYSMSNEWNRFSRAATAVPAHASFVNFNAKTHVNKCSINEWKLVLCRNLESFAVFVFYLRLNKRTFNHKYENRTRHTERDPPSSITFCGLDHIGAVCSAYNQFKKKKKKRKAVVSCKSVSKDERYVIIVVPLAPAWGPVS